MDTGSFSTHNAWSSIRPSCFTFPGFLFFQFLLLILDGLHLCVVFLSQLVPVCPVVVQTIKHRLDLFVEPGELLTNDRQHTMYVIQSMRYVEGAQLKTGTFCPGIVWFASQSTIPQGWLTHIPCYGFSTCILVQIPAWQTNNSQQTFLLAPAGFNRLISIDLAMLTPSVEYITRIYNKLFTSMFIL